MGCDIHCYFEYKIEDLKDYSSFSYHSINLGRDYGIFASIANVRNYGEIYNTLKPRGLPENRSWVTDSGNNLYIVDSETIENGCCKRSDAERWVNGGRSKYTDEKKTHVTNPDWHSHSWLECDEFEKAINGWQKIAEYKIDPCYFAAIELLKSFKKQGLESRIVFWFDN